MEPDAIVALVSAILHGSQYPAGAACRGQRQLFASILQVRDHFPEDRR
jgi:hypothetical protein